MTPEFDGAALEDGRLFVARPVEFLRGVVDLEGLPPADLPEVAFAGRSNVGKSTLLNALLNRKALARASNEPGRTRELNYFVLAEALYLVDLPGYGYARASKTAIEKWTKLTLRYLKGRPTLKRVFLLVDSRRGIMAPDLEIMDLLDTAAVVYQIVLTKTDKLKTGELEKVEAATRAALAKRPASHPLLHETSSVNGGGLEGLRAELAVLADWKAGA